VRAFLYWLRRPERRVFKVGAITIAGLVGLYLAYQLFQALSFLRSWDDPRNRAFLQWARGDEQARAELIHHAAGRLSRRAVHFAWRWLYRPAL
jgi:hypothetical protein